MSKAVPRARQPALIVSCTDMDRSERFYRDVLGAIPDPRDGYGCRWMLLDELLFSLVPNASEPAGVSPRRAAFNLWVEVDDLAAAAAVFARHGVTVLQPSDGTFMVIADPDGLVIEVWQHESNA
jgi:catechol 2,3-dioxygenase-like lactoylglutathione lyase family enzyme